IIRKADSVGVETSKEDFKLVRELEPAERDVLGQLSLFEARIRDAAKEYSPSVIANYAFDVAKQYNQFYQSIPIFNEEDPAKLKFRIALSETVAVVLKK